MEEIIEIENHVPDLSLSEMSEEAHEILPLLDRAKKTNWKNNFRNGLDLKSFRKMPYIFCGEETTADAGAIQMATGLPDLACVGINRYSATSWTLLCLRKLTKPPTFVLPIKGETLYEVCVMESVPKWIGIQMFVTIDETGNVHACDHIVQTPRGSVVHNYANVWKGGASTSGSNIEDIVRLAINMWKGKSFCWNITFSSKLSSVTFGFDLAEAKVIFKERQEKLTASGKKKPIIHFVKSHYRKLKPTSVWKRFVYFILRKKVTATVKTHIRGSSEFMMGKYAVQITQGK